ncbi:MAG: polyribonucleotide nucleotidyltransferase [Anaerolineales bacterium]
MKPEAKQYRVTIGGREVIVESGHIAGLAGGAVTYRYGDSMMLATASMSPNPREGIDFFPLSVDYEERMYAGGRIPGSFFRREGRPSTDAILTARLVDRPLRPLFPKDLRNDVQVILYSLSADGENPLDIMAVNAASCALMISNVPWGGPIGAVRIGLLDGEFVVNPTFAQLEESTLDLRLAGTRDAILMVECGANEVPEDVMVRALEFGHQAIQPLVDMQEKMAAEIGKPKSEYQAFGIAESLQAQVNQMVSARLDEIVAQGYGKVELSAAVDALEAETVAALATGEEGAPLAKDVSEAYHEAYKQAVRRGILNAGIRPDGRKTDEIRPIWCDVDFSPRAHGSGLFTRGETQVLTLATLGTPREAQTLDNLTPIDAKRYIHHYNFPPFSTGEVWPLRGAKRREIGHGALAERALEPVIPSEDEFPYTLRLVSEVLSSNGSTSMASVCGSTLALMDTGVPIKAPVAGIAMGLIKEGEKYAVLTDIQGLEDHLGDMDFKVAGTQQGITALQMDIKIKGLSAEIMSQALEQARKARLSILDKMLAVIPTPRPELKPFVPRIVTIKIPVDKIGAIIGPGGKNIRALQEESGTQIDIGEDGTVFIAATTQEGERIAREKIELMTDVPKIGRIYTGRVVRTTNFGAFVEILPNQDGMVHISQLDVERVERVEDVVNVGDEITVMVTDIDSQGKVRLSRQAVLEGWTVDEAIQRDRGGSSKPKGGPRGRSGDRGGRRR